MLSYPADGICAKPEFDRLGVKLCCASGCRPGTPWSPGCTGDTGPPGVLADGILSSAQSAGLDRLVSGIEKMERVEMVVWLLRLDVSENAGGDDLLETSGLCDTRGVTDADTVEVMSPPMAPT
jgi:hypothetical protein